MPVQGSYRFRFQVPNLPHESGQTFGFWIDYDIDEQPILLTHMTGKLHSLKGTTLLKSLLTYPWMAARVMARIHYQALHLWLKGMVYHPKPLPPKERVTS